MNPCFGEYMSPLRFSLSIISDVFSAGISCISASLVTSVIGISLVFNACSKFPIICFTTTNAFLCEAVIPVAILSMSKFPSLSVPISCKQ